MRYLGDVTKIDGSKIEPVDCITFGFPCQSLSVAGKRHGIKSELAGDATTTRSGLFWEAIRVIKEMREHDKELRGADESVRNARPWIRPRFTVAENVKGLFSSQSGEDFQTVITETIRVIEPEAPPVPIPEKGWPMSGVVHGDNWSVAWVCHDAQWFGVPQRRQRVSLVADYGGLSAGKVLALIHFAPEYTGDGEVSAVSESVSGDTEPGEEAWEGTA